MADFPPVLRDFAKYKLNLDFSQNTIYDYLWDLQLFFRFIILYKDKEPSYEKINNVSIQSVDLSFVQSVSALEIREFLSYINIDRGNQASARARKLSAVRSFYHYLNTQYITDYNPTVNIETPKLPKKLPKFLTLEESITLLECVENDEDSKTRLRDYCIITLFLNCGMRLSELCGIDLRDIDPKLESLHVTGKGNKERLIYMNDACRAAITAYLPERNSQGTELKDKNALFISSHHRRISQKTVQWMVYKYLDMAGFGNRQLSVHKLRHTAATLMYQNGHVDVRVLKDILGHEQLNTTQIYTHVSDAQMRDAINQNPLSDIGAPKKRTLQPLAKPQDGNPLKKQ